MAQIISIHDHEKRIVQLEDLVVQLQAFILANATPEQQQKAQEAIDQIHANQPKKGLILG